MGYPSEWGEVFWALVPQWESFAGLSFEREWLREREQTFVAYMRQFEKNERNSARVLLRTERVEAIIHAFLDILDEVVGGYDKYPPEFLGNLRSKTEETLVSIRSRVGEEPGIAY